jgi:hypothetical protein
VCWKKVYLLNKGTSSKQLYPIYLQLEQNPVLVQQRCCNIHNMIQGVSLGYLAVSGSHSLPEKKQVGTMPMGYESRPANRCIGKSVSITRMWDSKSEDNY